jgi:transcriptional regulator of acetoin/glycerol metabolism
MEEEALERLVNYDWPGNIRELINAIEYAFVLCSGDEIKKNNFPPNINGKNRLSSAKRPKNDRRTNSEQKEVFLDALKKTGGNKSEAAKILGISRVTLWKRLKEHDIQVNRAVQG